MPDSIHDDIRAALDSTKEAPPAGTPPSEAPSGRDDFAPATSEVLPPVMPDNKDKEPAPPKTKAPPETPPRGPDGKFLPQTPPTPQVPGQPPAPASQPSVPATPEGSVHFDPAKPPAAWTQPMKEKWAALPEDIRTEITRREEATATGVQKLMKHYEPMQEIYNSVAPFEQYFEHIQEDPRQYLHSMITMEQTLRLGNPAQKMELLLAVAETYGVPLRNALDSALGGKLNDMLAQAHQQHQTPTPVPPQVQKELEEHRQWRAQVEDSMAQGELQDFAAQPGHEYLDHVRDDMADLIEHGVVETYQDAYDLACWRNPQIRVAIQSGAVAAPAQNPVQQRQAAAAAVVAPSSAPLVESGDEPKEDDDLYESVRKAWNAAATNRA